MDRLFGTKNVIVFTVMMITVIMLVLGNLSEFQLLNSEITSLEDVASKKVSRVSVMTILGL